MPPRNFEFLYTDHDIEQIWGAQAWEKASEVEPEEGFEGDAVQAEYNARLEALNHAVDTLERIINFISDYKDIIKDNDFNRHADALLRDIEGTIERCNDPYKFFA